MTEIFALAIYTCVTLGDASLNGTTTTCQWRTAGNLYRRREACDAAGQARIGKPYFTDFFPNPTVENFRCDQWHVEE